jgi:hypothetical protein
MLCKQVLYMTKGHSEDGTGLFKNMEQYIRVVAIAQSLFSSSMEAAFHECWACTHAHQTSHCASFQLHNQKTGHSARNPATCCFWHTPGNAAVTTRILLDCQFRTAIFKTLNCLPINCHSLKGACKKRLAMALPTKHQQAGLYGLVNCN